MLNPSKLQLTLCRLLCLSTLVSCFLTTASTVQAQVPVPLSSPFVVNTWTDGDQFFPRVAVQPDGEFWVVWGNSSGGQPIDGSSIQAQNIASDGTFLGSQLQVNAYTTGLQLLPDLAIQSTGDFVVVWMSYGSVGNDYSYTSSIQGQRFASDGSTLGSQFQINSYTTSNQNLPRIAVDGTDQFLVVWDGVSGSPGGGIQGQRFDATAQPIGDEFLISNVTVEEQKSHPDVAMASDGRFVVVWQALSSIGDDSSAESIQARLFDSLGVPTGPQFVVNTFTTGSQRRPSVDMQDDGTFIVVWESEPSANTEGSSSSIQAQRYHSDGTPLGKSIAIYSPTEEFPVWASLRHGKADDFVVAWTNYPNYRTPYWSVEARRFSNSGEPVGDRFLLSQGETFHVERPHLAFDAAGNFVAVWHSDPITNDDTSGYGVLARRYCNPACLFVDGFESGDTGGWINAVGN